MGRPSPRSWVHLPVLSCGAGPCVRQKEGGDRGPGGPAVRPEDRCAAESVSVTAATLALTRGAVDETIRAVEEAISRYLAARIEGASGLSVSHLLRIPGGAS